ncbi:unnamed protein product [Adineta steineri]|uniref:Uncharacterized protein n=1 Tax=Adineta steineri TaxID=433720 RepID=A0A819Q226_9BILA|nr:unnamed protein product [Adineta steineri]
MIPYQLNIWLGLFLWTTGNIGCIGNMIVYGSRKSRKQAYSIYLFASAIADFHYFNFVLLTRIIQDGFGILLINRYTVVCKLRQFSTLWGNVVGFSLFSFATIDRLLSAQRQNKYRQWSNRIDLAYKMIVFIPLFWFLLIGHRLILYRITDDICSPPSGFYSYYDNYFQVIFSSLFPAISMSILTSLLIKSVRLVVQRRIAPMTSVSSITTPHRSMINKLDTRLTIMLISESFIAVITYIPYAIQLSYANITQNWYKSPLHIAWENILTELIHLFSYIFFATSFYVSLFSNVAFRRKILNFITVMTEVASLQISRIINLKFCKQISQGNSDTKATDSMNNLYNINKENVEVMNVTRSVEKFVGDTLMTNEQKLILNQFYGKCDQYWQLIYKATRDGFDATSFHRLCNNQGPTMTLIQSTTNCLFGGYASKSWQSSSDFVDASESFLYLLTNTNGNQPTKFPYNNDGKALYNMNSYGPIFGGGADLYISSQSNKYLCSYCNLGVSYSNSLDLGINTFTGSQFFQTSEIEIFKLS